MPGLSTPSKRIARAVNQTRADVSATAKHLPRIERMEKLCYLSCVLALLSHSLSDLTLRHPTRQQASCEKKRRIPRGQLITISFMSSSIYLCFFLGRKSRIFGVHHNPIIWGYWRLHNFCVFDDPASTKLFVQCLEVLQVVDFFALFSQGSSLHVSHPKDCKEPQICLFLLPLFGHDITHRTALRTWHRARHDPEFLAHYGCCDPCDLLVK